MDKDDVIAFFRFLSEATEDELDNRRELFDGLLRKISPRSDAAADIRFCLRKIDEELVARNEFLFHQQSK